MGTGIVFIRLFHTALFADGSIEAYSVSFLGGVSPSLSPHPSNSLVKFRPLLSHSGLAALSARLASGHLLDRHGISPLNLSGWLQPR